MEISRPPSVAGFFHRNVTEFSSKSTILTSVGTPGVVKGFSAFTGSFSLAAGDSPSLLMANTSNLRMI